MAADCTNNHLTVEEIFANILTRDENGNCALRLIPVTAADPDVDWSADCDHANESLADKLRLVIGLDAEGKLGIRVILVESVDEDCINCNNNNIPLGDQLWNHVIGTADDDLPALRLAQPAP